MRPATEGKIVVELESSIRVVEKRRLRDAIEKQVRRYLENGGRITVVDAPAGSPGNAVHSSSSLSPDELLLSFD